MIVQALSKLGENIVANTLTSKWAFQKKRIKYLFYINRDSELIQWVILKKPVQKEIPIAIYEECLSTARVKVEDCIPYLFFDWLKNFQDEDAKKVFFSNMAEFSKSLNNPIIDSIAHFIREFDWNQFIEDNKCDKKGYFYVFVQDVVFLDPFADEEVIQKTNEYIYRKLKEKDMNQIDSIDRPGRYIKNSSGLIQAGRVKSRLITSLAYKEHYYDDEPVCNISILSEFYMFVGMEYLLNNGVSRIGTRVYALYSVDNGIIIPLWLDLKRYMEVFNHENTENVSWNELKKQIKRSLKKARLTYLELDCKTQGRIRPCVCYEYNDIEAELVVKNILDFMERTTDFETGKSFGNHVLKLIKLGRHEKKDSYRTQQEYGQYLQNVFRGECQAIARTIITPRIVQMMSDSSEAQYEEYRNYARWISNLMVHSDTQEIPELYTEVEYLMGYLLGICQLYELKSRSSNNKTIVETYFREYINCPSRTWKRIWSRIALVGNADDYNIKRIYKVSEQLKKMNWGKNKRLESYKIVEGYNITLSGYWKKLTIQQRMKEIFDYMIEGDIHYVPLALNEEDKSECSYDITIKEIKKEEKNNE